MALLSDGEIWPRVPEANPSVMRAAVSGAGPTPRLLSTCFQGAFVANAAQEQFRGVS